MLALTYRLDTGVLSTLIRGIALAAVLIIVVVACAALAPLLSPLCNLRRVARQPRMMSSAV